MSEPFVLYDIENVPRAQRKRYLKHTITKIVIPDRKVNLVEPQRAPRIRALPVPMERNPACNSRSPRRS